MHVVMNLETSGRMSSEKFQARYFSKVSRVFFFFGGGGGSGGGGFQSALWGKEGKEGKER